jgi:acyl carrier protein
MQGIYVAPETETEKTLTEIWAKLLKQDAKAISATANFFELGGHSLLGIRLAMQINQHFGFEVPLKNIFELSTLQAIGKLIDQQKQPSEEDFFEAEEFVNAISDDEVENLLKELSVEKSMYMES